jgi:hypothetical protein
MLAALDAGLVMAFLIVYLLIIRGQGNRPVYWFLAFLVAATVCALVAVVRRTPQPLIGNLVILAVCAVLGLFSIGALLLPAIVVGVMSYRAGSRPVRA